MKLTLSFFLLLISTFIMANDRDIAALYAKHQIEGTMIIASLDGQEKYIHNKKRAQQQLIPASTFKILNTLIALEEQIIQDENVVIKWDGKDKGWAQWNQDQNLATAFSHSCVWCYQEFAQQIGNQLYLEYFKKLSYGNQKTGPVLSTFWLDGDLAISPKQQIDFLKQVYLEQLPFKTQHIQLLKKIMLVEETPSYTLWAKTGWATGINVQHGWYVGYVEVRGKVWFFANNILIKSKSDLKLRQQLLMEALKLKKII